MISRVAWDRLPRETQIERIEELLVCRIVGAIIAADHADKLGPKLGNIS